MPTPSSYPTGGQYRDAIQNASRCFKDPVLVGGHAALDSLGLPKPISGAFASVFTVLGADGRRWAVKCFTRFVGDQEARFRLISDALSPIDKTWRVDFEYVPEGILCQGTWYPILKMEWLEASGLLPFVEEHLWQPATLADLAAKFCGLATDLQELGIAHGDLQHGNLLITPAGELKLIDYDGMYVPGLQTHGASEIGHVNYQSPARTPASWGPNLDRFSAWVIYVSLVALTIDPTLWSLLHSEGDESLLFKKEDFLEPHQSRALVLLSQCADERLRGLRDSVAEFWTNDLDQIPILDSARIATPNRQQTFAQPNLGSSTASAVNDVSAFLSEWLASVERGSPGDAEATNDPSWLLAKMPPVELRTHRPNSRVLRNFCRVWLIVLATFATLGAVEGQTADIGVLDILLLLVLSAVLTCAFVRSEEVRAKRSVAAVHRARRSEATSAKKAASKAERDRRDVEKRERATIGTFENRLSDGRRAHERETEVANLALAQRMAAIAKQQQSAASEESGEIGRLLRTLQEQYLVNQLATASLASARVQGIGQQLKTTLAAHGIRTAADFSGIRYGTGSEVFLVLSNGRLVHPSGIGQAKAIALESWRRDVEARARRTLPSALPPQQTQAVRLKYAQRRQSLAQDEQRARAEFATQQHRIHERWSATNRSLSVEAVQSRENFRREQRVADDALAMARRKANDATWQQTLAARDLAVYRQVTYLRYCKAVIVR